MQRSTRLLWATVCLAFVCAACGRDGVPTSGTPLPTPPPSPPPPTGPALAVSDLTAINVGTEKMCASTGDIDTEIDQLTFDFGNPTGRSLQSTPVLREGSTLSLGTVGVCGTQDPCRAQFESVTRVDGTACFIEGTPQSSSGQIRLYTKQIFRPVETYRIRLGTGTTASNTIEASVVRLPGASNDHAAVAIVDGIGTRSGNAFSAGATISVYRPPQNPSAPRVLDILAAWYYPD